MPGVGLTVSNSGSGSLKIGNISAPSAPFVLESDNCSGQVLAASQSCSITVGFVPETQGSFSDTLRISSSDRDNPNMTVALTGTVRAPAQLLGTVTDSSTGLPLSNIVVSVTVPRSLSPAPSDYMYTSEGALAIPPDDADLSYSFQQVEYEAVKNNDGIKAVCRSNSVDDYCMHLLKVRNPVSISDHIKVTWNGAACHSGTCSELLAQSFRAGRSGKLTKVSLLLTGNSCIYTPASGVLYAILKSSLNGEAESVMASSNPVSLGYVPASATWVDFNFSTPAPVAAGQTYYIELYRAGYFGYNDIMCYMFPSPVVNLATASPNPYSSGNAFSRCSGVWQDIASSAAFKTYLDNTVDQQQLSTNSNTGLWGISLRYPTLIIYNRSSGQWEWLDSKSHGFGYDDVTLEGNKNINTSDYYDNGGWISVMVYSGSDPYFGATALATDLFKVEFQDVKTATTDSNGTYAISGLPSGNYTAVFEKPGYEKKTLTGTSVSGQSQTLNVQLTPLAPATITGTVRNCYEQSPVWCQRNNNRCFKNTNCADRFKWALFDNGSGRGCFHWNI